MASVTIRAQDAVQRVHRLLNRGHREVVDADLSNYFGEIPHAELMRSVARRVSDGRLLGWIKAWLEMPVEEDDGKGGKRRTNQARRERKGTPQGAPVSPLFSNIYMRRFIVGWKVLGHARRFEAEIVNYADDFVVCGKAPADECKGRPKSVSSATPRGQRAASPLAGGWAGWRQFPFADEYKGRPESMSSATHRASPSLTV